MNRRNLLILSATTVGAAALAGTMTVIDDPYAYLPSLLREYIGEYTMDEEEERQFIQAFSDYYGLDKVVGFVGLHRIREGTSLGTPYTHSKVDLYERRLVSDFFTSTDFYQKYQTERVPHVSFVGFKQPCRNPFARRA
jgi:hypothetical protein